ncbi:MAG: YdcH family protein [Gammaproteobacteria bacterium]
MTDKHDLIHEFPEYRDAIHTLKMEDRHFARLFNEYHEVDQEIVRIENGAQASSDDYLEDRKKTRLRLKDELFSMLRKT